MFWLYQVHGQRSKNMACRFASSTQQESEELLEDKDSENTKRSTKVAKELFYEYLKEKKYPEVTRQKRISASVKIFKLICGSAKKGWIASYSMGSLKSLRFAFVVIFFKPMYNKAIIRFVFLCPE